VTVLTDDNNRLWTADAGSGSPLVMCHGGPGLWDMFGSLAGTLAPRLRVIRWDQRGCGRSGEGGPYQLERFVADVDAVRAGLGLDRIALLGHSWGATLALAYALRHPGRVRRLIYVSGTGIGWDWREPFARNIRARLASQADRIASLQACEPSPTRDRELTILQWSAEFTGPDAMSLARGMATPWFGVNHEAYRDIWAELEQTWRVSELAAACRRLTVPVLIVDGSEDLRPRWAVDSLEEALPDVTRVTLRAGHVPWLEVPAEFATAVADFATEDSAAS
jgi:proline iminopeptidase